MCPMRVKDASTQAKSGAYRSNPIAIVIRGSATRKRRPINLIKSIPVATC